jgi:hypothetical protein
MPSPILNIADVEVRTAPSGPVPATPTTARDYWEGE